MHATTTSPTAIAPAGFERKVAHVCDRHFGIVVSVLVLAAALVRAAILREFLLENPFAEFPTLDGELYWNRAGEIAAGHWVGEAPFHIAPLYSYALGVLRRLGGNLTTVYALQIAIHLATGALVGVATRRRFGAVAGCAAVAIFLGLGEPALLATRVLGATLQLLLVTLLWLDWSGLAREAEPGRLHVARVGALLGLFALSFPAALLLVPVYAIWLVLRVGERRADFLRAAIGVASALAVIGTATAHNAVVAGELIPITSHAGITLAAGNGPGSVGIFTPLTETRNNVKDQAHESALAYERATGRRGGWGEIDRYYRDRVIAWWVTNPLDATTLFARKAWWFLTSRHYDNVTAFELERSHGLQDAALFVPVETPWILGLALLGAWLAAPRTRRFTPELALIALPFVVCLAFMYSARYRAVALPVLCGLAGFGIAYWRNLPRPRVALAAAAALPCLFLALNSAIGFGGIDFMRKDFAALLSDAHIDVARASLGAGDVDAAEAALQRADAADASRNLALRELAALRLAEGRPEDARSVALEAVHRDSTDEDAHRLLYDAQIGSGDFRYAAITLTLIEKLAPKDGSIQIAMTWFYAACPDPAWRNGPRSLHHARVTERLLGRNDPTAAMAQALALAGTGDFETAIPTAERGLALARERGDGAMVDDFDFLLLRFQERKLITARPPLLSASRASS